MKKLIYGALGLVALAAGVAFAQTAIPYVASLGQSDIQQVIKNANPQAGNTYATITQLRAWMLGGASGHSATPSIGSCGGGSPAIVGSDFAFRVTQGTSATGCVVTFAAAFTSIPACVAVNETAPATSTPAYSVTTSAITLVTASTSGEIWDVVCVARNGG
jgi:hypothetical protein